MKDEIRSRAGAVVKSIFVLTFFALLGRTTAQDKAHSEPVPDAVYLQEVGRKIVIDTPLHAVAVRGGTAFVGSAERVSFVMGPWLMSMDDWPDNVELLASSGDSLWAVSRVDSEAHLFKEEAAGWKKLNQIDVLDITSHLGETIVLDADGKLWKIQNDKLEPYADGRSDLRHLASYSESLYVATSNGIGVWTGSRIEWDEVIDWGNQPLGTISDLLPIGSRLYIGTDRGLAVLRGMTLDVIRGEDGLCYEDIRCLAEGFDGDLWIGTTDGAIRYTREGEFHYFGADRWLPNPRVNAIAANERTAYIATDGGLGIIDYVPYTLAKKADYYEQHIDNWGVKRMGFVHKLEWDGERNEWVREISDNDGGWSIEYLAAMSYKFLVTGDEKARAEAVKTFNAVKWLEEITPIDGFPARSIWAVGEVGHKAMHGSGGLPAEWHAAEDTRFEWKADTSSDETDAHFYGVSIFHDLVARGEEKRRAAEHLSRIASHIIDNGWVLRDMDGQPTRWARWDPDYLQRPYGYYARGLNGMEVMAYMRVAHTLTGDEKFEKAFGELIKLGYHREALRQKLTFPPDYVVPWDDRLAFFSYFNILRYEKDSELRSIYRRSLERSWEVKRSEHSAWFNFIYGALTGNDCEADKAVAHLREWPLDMIEYSYRNSHRADLQVEAGYRGYTSATRALSPRENGPMRWDNTTLRLDGGSGGRAVTDPSGWLHAYWMGRYYGFIEPPEANDPELISVSRSNEQLGAKPYAGPEPR